MFILFKIKICNTQANDYYLSGGQGKKKVGVVRFFFPNVCVTVITVIIANCWKFIFWVLYSRGMADKKIFFLNISDAKEEYAP